MDNINNSIVNESIEKEYARLRAIEMSKKVFSWWDVFLFIFLFGCAICFVIGFGLFLLGGIGFFMTPDGTPELNNNGFWAITNKFGSWNEYNNAVYLIISKDSLTDYQQFLKNAYILKDLYNAGFLMWLIPTILFVIFSITTTVIYIFWLNGYIEKTGKYIFNKIQSINKKIDEYEDDDEKNLKKT